MDERIELYFNEKLPPGDKEEFEKELLQSSQLADEVAFYLSTRAVLREQILAERHTEWQKLTSKQRPGRSGTIKAFRPWYYAAASVVLVMMALSWFLLRSSTSAPTAGELAGNYIETNFETFATSMGTETDSLQLAFERYNQGKYTEARSVGRELVQRNPTHEEALKLLGAIALRQTNYDEAILYFHRLAEIQGLRANPGTFYEALTYVQRGQPSDMEKARELLQRVISENLEGQEEAQEMLRALNEKQRSWRDLIPGWGEREAYK
jgi:tetratricopeptide (TPR) repeat protein